MKTFRAVVLTLEDEIILTIGLVCTTEDEAKARAEDLLEDDLGWTAQNCVLRARALASLARARLLIVSPNKMRKTIGEA